ncbi:RNA-binding S4 domain-containing protein [Sideroxydans lithotrophicus]|uniref:RNA-binding S4 domain protein n=1 Tax=Sideroxydans lithotrophicus (strain ES-1) TaxID=580332 RepID=D5CN68_SIDLE|nr:RNA-binding S4 domain-containing protein [Sideroxydans lithotrophicus]ADE12765.1 RNA-binding S4 domain protein [Sideroxydans lithotrophicus ES-1]
MAQGHPQADDKLRIDKWLWAARFFKTRSLAVDAVESGKVTMGGVRIKPAKAIVVGDQLDIRLGQYHFAIEVLALANRRGPAAEAQKLYRESDESRARRAEIAANLKALPQPTFKGRPTKRDRRDIERFEAGTKSVRKSAWGDFE